MIFFTILKLRLTDSPIGQSVPKSPNVGHLTVSDLDGEEDEGLPLVPSHLRAEGPGEETIW